MTERTWRTLAMGRRGAVSSNHPLATRAGLRVLEDGGNAFDAAVAVGTTIAVVEPHSNGVGGDAFFTLWIAEDARATVVHAAAPSAAAATLDRYASGIAELGPLAAMPPGAVAAWQHLIDHYATKPASELYRSAVHAAREGFAASRRFCEDVERHAAELARDPGCAAVYLKRGKAPSLGATIRNPALARTLELLALRGAEQLFGGSIGGQLVEFVKKNGGLLALDDLASFRAHEQPPISTHYRGLEVLNAGPPSMGFALLLELGIVREIELGKLEPFGADHVHALVEAKKLAFVEREELGGDPAHVRPPLELVLGEDHARELAAQIDPTRAARRPGRATRAGDTTYFAIVDGWGNAVSGIQSIANPFGCAALDPETGILLNSRMVWFHTEPDHPNVVGPRKHVRNTINPPLALANGELYSVFGTPGGDAQVQVTLQLLTSVVDFGLDPQQALEAPRWTHFQPGTGSYFPHVDPDSLRLESRFSVETIDELRRRGHAIERVGPLEGGSAASMIVRDPNGLLLAGSDPRRDGAALAF